MKPGDQYISNDRVYIENTKRKWNSKKEVLSPHISGKVLHLGFVGQNRDGQRNNVWLHGWLDENTDSLVGIDIRQEEVERAKKEGFDVYCQDAQNFDIPHSFDTIVCTNVIEHLPSPGSMLESCKKHLSEDGSLLITTGKTFTPWNFARKMKGSMNVADEHCMWFCKDTLTRLLKTQGFRVAEYDNWGFDRIGTTPIDKLYRKIERGISNISKFEKIDSNQHFVVAKLK